MLHSGQNGQLVQQLRHVVPEHDQEHAIVLTMIAREPYPKMKAVIYVDVSHLPINVCFQTQ